MRALVQRVSKAGVEVDGVGVASIGEGLLVLVGAARDDTAEDGVVLARKIAGLRIFEDRDGKMNLSVLDIGGEVLVVSQFTLYADTRKGKRPSFGNAMPPDRAEELIARFIQALRSQGVNNVQQGVFGAYMKVHLVNDGPVTLMIETKGGRFC